MSKSGRVNTYIHEFTSGINKEFHAFCSCIYVCKMVCWCLYMQFSMHRGRFCAIRLCVLLALCITMYNKYYCCKAKVRYLLFYILKCPMHKIFACITYMMYLFVCNFNFYIRNVLLFFYNLPNKLCLYCLVYIIFRKYGITLLSPL